MTRGTDAGDAGAAAAAALFAGPGEVRALGRSCDWGATPLGPVSGWSPALRAAVRLMLDAPGAMGLYAGPDYITLYNDAHRRVLGAKHPAALGRPASEVWAEIWPAVEHQFDQVREGGPGLDLRDVPFTLARRDDEAAETGWFDYALSPIREESTDDGPGAVVAILIVVTETTARFLAETALAADRARLSRLLDAAPAVMAVYSGPEHVITYVNPTWERVVGKPGALGRTIREVFPEMIPSGIFEELSRVYQTGEPWTTSETPLPIQRRPDGPVEASFWSFVWLPLPGAFPVGPSGLGGDVLVHAVDVTAQVRARQEIEAAHAAADLARERLEVLLEHLPVGVTLAEAPSGRLLVSNPAVERIWGLDTPAAKVAEYSALYVGLRPGPGPESARRYANDEWPLARALTTGEPVADELMEILRPDGTRVLASVNAAPVRDAGGAVVGGVVMTQDVTERERLLAESERARAAAAAAAARHEAVLASIADPFYLLDREWRFIYVNDAAEPLLQTTRDRLLGRTLWDAFPGVIGSPFEGPYREAMATGRVTSAEAHFPPLGTWFDVRTYPWASGLMVHFRDVGERKAAESERDRLLADAEAARAEAETANRAKSEFLAVMSHELRTPLNAIGGYAELMEMGIRGPVTAQQREDLRRLQSSQRHLLGLINEVLNYAKLETGAVHYDLTEVLVRDALAGAEALLAPQALTKGLILSVAECAPDIAVCADAEKLRQVLVNLASNAVKFTDSGGRIELECAERGACVAITVRDSGIGIAAEQLERIFEPFVQVRSDLTRTAEGTGLGLAISRDLARGMNGDLTAESTPGVGSTFTLVLPRAQGGSGAVSAFSHEGHD